MWQHVCYGVEIPNATVRQPVSISEYGTVYTIKFTIKAFQLVKKNKGAPRDNKVRFKDYERDLEHNLEVLQNRLKGKTYKARPVRRKMKDKDDGKQRPLGIPAVQDRVVQAAIRNIIEPIFEEDFLPCSYEVRPNISAHMALDKVSEHLQAGFEYVIDTDLKVL